VRFNRSSSKLVVWLNNGCEVGLPLEAIKGLEEANPAELAAYEISPSGQGIHFPAIDADIFVPSLLHTVFQSRKWLAATNGKLGGQSKSTAKAEAARQNGKLGGRPRKSTNDKVKERE
jgi:hypothetical protein